MTAVDMVVVVEEDSEEDIDKIEVVTIKDQEITKLSNASSLNKTETANLEIAALLLTETQMSNKHLKAFLKLK